MQKQRPILFSTTMVKAILDGNKTKTRRYVKQQEWLPHKGGSILTCELDQSPYGDKGDYLWVRESYMHNGSTYIYAATDQLPADKKSWKNAMFMPRAASRITLQITDTRLERLQSITEHDALEEGVVATGGESAIANFRSLWNTINSLKPDRLWEKNPYIWVIEFKVISPLPGGKGNEYAG